MRLVVGFEFVHGGFGIAELRNQAVGRSESAQRSGKQERCEILVDQYLMR